MNGWIVLPRSINVGAGKHCLDATTNGYSGWVSLIKRSNQINLDNVTNLIQAKPSFKYKRKLF